MSFADRQTRSPRPFDAERGREAAAYLPEATGALRELLQGAAGCSPFLSNLIAHERDWLAEALDAEPEETLERLLADTAGGEAPQSCLRKSKGRLALLAALADLGGVWSLEEVTGALTRFADSAVQAALSHAIAEEVRRGRLPGGEEADGMVVVAMGKMGAWELNYSSDIDLICLFDESRHEPDRHAELRNGFVRATRRMSAALSETTGEGYVFRTDLRLRPDPSVTQVCLSMHAAERYYEAMGRAWERAAWIKARPAAGAIAAGDGFIERLRPFIWRKHLDFAAIEDAHAIRQRIREHKGLHDTGLEERDVKLGPGGIREIEFFTQTRQIIAGGRDPSLRVRGTVEGLRRLVAAGWVGREEAELLIDDYRALREVEHRLQMVSDQQTQLLPATEEGFERLAAFTGQEVDALRADLTARFERVGELTEGFFTPERPASEPEMTEAQREGTERWTAYPALRSPRAVEIFERIRPKLLSRLVEARRPDQALNQFGAFLSRLPAGVQIFSLFEANPQLIDLLVDIADSAPELARHLGDNPGVLDAVIGGSFFEPWPGAEALAADLSRRLAALDDYEAQLDATRRWAREWHFRAGVHHLRGVVDAAEAGQHYADLASAVVAALWLPVVAQFARTHGEPPGSGAAVLGMGSLGAERLSAASDLDLIVIYDAPGEEMSRGRRPLAARTYYGRLTKALVTALSAPTAEGRLYEVDMRLRPSGKQGPVAVSFDAFRSYHRDEAWTWEHLALTRARPVAGSAELGTRVEGFCRELIASAWDRARILSDTTDMRARLLSAHKPATEWDTKAGPGRMQDIQLIAAAATLLSNSPARRIDDQLATLDDEEQRAALRAAVDLLWPVQAASRLLAGGPLDQATAGLPLVLRECGAEGAEDLARRIAKATGAAAEAAETFLGRVPET